jgi:hypothetical protein
MDDPTSPPPPDRDLGPSTFPVLPEPLPVRMFVFTPTKDQKQCLNTVGSLEDCQVRPASSTDAVFGFAVHEHRPTRSVLHLGNDQGFVVLHLEDPLDFGALVVKDGSEYVIEKAVVPAPDSHRLVVRLDASDRERLVGVFSVRNKQGVRCFDDYQTAHSTPGSGESEDRALADEAAAFCSVDYALKVDDETTLESDDDSVFGSPWTRAPAGARLVAVDVARGDPRNETFAIVIWKARSGSIG